MIDCQKTVQPDARPRLKAQAQAATLQRQEDRRLGAAEIAALPREEYHAAKWTRATAEEWAGVQECSICLDEVCESETVIVLECRHLYHTRCLEGPPHAPSDSRGRRTPQIWRRICF